MSDVSFWLCQFGGSYSFPSDDDDGGSGGGGMTPCDHYRGAGDDDGDDGRGVGDADDD